MVTKGEMMMESLIFIVIMLAGHMLMMFIMPGMQGGHKNQNQHSDERAKLENKNKELKKELSVLKTKLNRIQS